MKMAKIISRIKGGLGNQLFCYAAARRLALVNNAELVLDNITGFIRDHQYKRQYALEHFRIPARKAQPCERLEPFERYRRGWMKWRSKRVPFEQRRYVEQERLDFDERLLHFKVKDSVYLDGYWQSENYFKDFEQVIRDDLRIIPPEDAKNRETAKCINSTDAVGMHVRWFDAPGASKKHNLAVDYYQRSLRLMDKLVGTPHYFVFSDDPQAAQRCLALPVNRVTWVSHNRGDQSAYADLWLMAQCRHFIIANSTFSWWGAWLGGGVDKVVVTPKIKVQGITAWGFAGLIPKEWRPV